METRLIIGDINSIFVRSLISKLKANYPNLRVDCLSTKRPLNTYNIADVLYLNKFSYNCRKYLGQIGHMGWFIGVIWWFIYRTEKVKYDVIQIHFAHLMHFPAFFLYKKSCGRIASILYGSDLLRCRYTNILKRMLANSDVINCSTVEMHKETKELLGNQVVANSIRITHNRFGLIPLETIKTAISENISKQKMLQTLGIENVTRNKSIVVVGYNAKEGQQHLEIIQSLITQDYNEVVFIFPMTYGVKDIYCSKVRAALRESGLNYIILDTYLSDIEIACLRLISDYFVQLQTTDALSGSMQEHLYAKNTVITGAWLPYSTFTEAGVRYEVVSSVSEIGFKLYQDLKTPSITAREKENNQMIIAKLSLWNSVIEGWYEI